MDIWLTWKKGLDDILITIYALEYVCYFCIN